MNEEEKQELETLRAEKLRREQVERARAALERGGVPQSFASLLAGGDDGDGGIPRGVSGVSGGGREKPSARFRAGGDGPPAPASQTGHPAAEIGDGL